MNTANPSDFPFGERSLAAVVFTDVVNFSLRVGADERLALQCVRRDFNLMQPLIPRFSGHLLKTMGDGQLIYFQSATNAVSCALAMQQALTEAARTLPPPEVLQHRIGIHLGDVFVSENDVHGNGVNIAARLQGRAEPGGICISQTVYDVVKHQLAIKVNYLGAQELKNIRDSIHIYQLLLEAAQDGTKAALPSPAPASGKVAGISAAPVLSSGGKVKPLAAILRTPETPFHIAILGDFSGRSSRAILEPLASRRPVVIDLDNLEDVLAKAQLRLPVFQKPGEKIDLHFSTLEDFHPDQFYQQIEPLRKLAQLRQRLHHPSTAATAAQECQTLLGQTPSAPSETAAAESESALMARLLGKAPTSAPAPKPTGPASIDAFIKNLVGSSSVPNSAHQDKELRAQLDLELTRQWRAILHHPDFQQIEAAWRSVAFLVHKFGGEENIQIHLLDVSKEELMADLQSAETGNTGFHQFLARESWGLLLGNYTFGETEAELEMLHRLAKISASAATPFVAAAHPHLANCESFHRQPDPAEWQRTMPAPSQQLWQALRQSPAARYLGLAAPRFLLRQPYGAGSDPIELFPFTELPADVPHEFYLWGNPAFLIGHMLAEAFREEGWGLVAARSGEVDDRPMHQFQENGETQVKPWAEAWLTERASDLLRQHGLIPILSIKNRNAVRIANLQSIAQPAQPLAWQAK